MVKLGSKPFLECSGVKGTGDKRFSAFCAYIKIDQIGTPLFSIESLYQSYKETGKKWAIIKDWSKNKGSLTKYGASLDDCKDYYSELWDLYFDQNPALLDVIASYEGFSDVFGMPGRVCQALEVYRIKKERTNLC